MQGDEIPLEARIIAAVDAWDAMTNDRPYRRSMGRAKAIEELEREAGRHFDPEVVRALLDVVSGRCTEGIDASIVDDSLWFREPAVGLEE